ncbi:MAG: Gfo/Idh/MocA family oxidoreductase [Chloroflexi bacterium]|nr:Gfo/Idh/MocA family oxidoreductase [Chloroflexota bacterium]
MTPDDIGVGILGSGNMAEVYIDALATQVRGARLSAIAMGSRAAGLAATHGVAAPPDAAALVARDDVQLVVIATPHSTHEPLAVAVARAGRHVYLEKPMAVDVAACDRIIAACGEAGVLLTVAKQTRHFEMTMHARRLIDEGAIGEVRIVRATSPLIGLELPDGHWIADPREGDLFLDWGAHACDAFRWFTGSEAIRVHAEVADFGATGHQGPTMMAQYRMADGSICQAFLSYEIPPPGLGSGSNTQYQVIGARGILEWDLDRIRLGDASGWQVVDEQPTWTDPWQPHHPRRIGNTARQVQAVVDALRTGSTPPVSGEDGRAAIVMASAASRAAATGMTVHLS